MPPVPNVAATENAGQVSPLSQNSPLNGTLQRIVEMGSRYGLSTFGPLAMSLAHFIAALLLLRSLQPAAFGIFSFALILVPLCLSMSGALIAASATGALRMGTLGEAELAMHLKGNALLGTISAAVLFLLMISSGASWDVALLLGVYAAAMTLRWFARTYMYITYKPRHVAASDLVYSCLLILGLLGLSITHRLNPTGAAIVLAVSATFAFVAIGMTFLGMQIRAIRNGSLLGYRAIWRDLTRWSLLGVVSTEITANAHAYLVTFISGPKAFALLAVGSLFMRPVSLCLTALPDLERPAMARSIFAGDNVGAYRRMREFRAASVAVWFGTVALTAAALIWVPHLFLKQEYDQQQVFIVVALWSVIMIVRLLRTPESVLLQAAREFRPLSSASLWSSVFSVVLTLVLLLTLGPVASLLGILVGDLVMTGKILALAKARRLNYV